MARLARAVRFARHQSGVAAIEMALIFPVMLILFVGMIDLTSLLSDNRRVSYSAGVVADVVTRLQASTTPAEVSDALEAAEIVMSAARAGPARVEVHNYWLDSNGAVAPRWDHDNGVGTPCSHTSPDPSLMSQDNDVIVAVVCVEHTPIIGQLLNYNIGTGPFTLREQIAMRPRQSLTLLCPLC